MSDFELLASYKTHSDLYRHFKAEDLPFSWASIYPMLFDEDDLRIAQAQAEMGYHFFEWLAAILIFHSFGLYSLVEQYQFRIHSKKQEILSKLTTKKVITFMQSHPDFGNVQCPDLLVYSPDYSDWYFCEVKGPNDKMRNNQIDFFKELSNKSKKPIKVVEFKTLNT